MTVSENRVRIVKANALGKSEMRVLSGIRVAKRCEIKESAKNCWYLRQSMAPKIVTWGSVLGHNAS